VRAFTRVLPAIVAIVVALGCSRDEHKLSMILPRLPVDHAIATDFVEVMNNQSQFSITAIPSGDSQQTSLEALAEGRADIGFVSNTEAFHSGIDTVMPMYANVLHILVRRGLIGDQAFGRADVATLRALFASGRVYAGPPGAPSRVMLEAFAKENGVPEQEIRFIEHFDIPDCPEVFALFVPVLRDIESRIQGCGAKDYLLRGLGSPASLGRGSRVEAATLLDPSLRAFVVPAGLYGDEITPEATVTLASDKMLVARSDVPAGVIYDLISEVLRLRPALAANEPTLFHGLSDNFGSFDSKFVLHPGAQAYIERDEPSVYERYSGIAEVLVTLFVASVSGLYASVRLYNVRRKNRIDVFYVDAMRLRKSVNEDSSRSERRSAITQVRTLQTRAFEMLVDEKLAADESFRIFITLSNDIIRELQQSSAAPWSDSDD